MKFEQYLIEDQIKELEKELKDSDDYLKAPNGKKSNLPEKQWLMVRTDAFKKWFGDWEANKTSSKVIDENGEPLVVYHGTSSNFDVFDKKKAGAGNDKGLRGKGFYFSPNINTSKSYGSTVIDCFLNIRNPFVPESFNSISEIISIFNSDGDYDDDDFKGMFEFNDGEFKIYAPSSGTITGMMKDHGYDGVIYKKRQEVIAFEPNQIKSIDNNGSFSKSSNHINESSDYKNLVMYHGSTTEFTEFKVGGGMLGDGIYFTPSKKRAVFYPKMHMKKTGTDGDIFIYEVQLKVENPLVLNELPMNKIDSDSVKKRGYDAIILMENGKIREMTVFKKEQIKILEKVVA